MKQACDIEIIAIGERKPKISQAHKNGQRSDYHWRQVESRASYSEFAIPPIYRDSINRLQLPIFEVAKNVLSKAGLLSDEYENIRDKTDVIFCNCLGMDRAFKNFQRIYSKYLIGKAAQALDADNRQRVLDQAVNFLGEELGASSHDKVGEMASTIPARVAAQFGLKGRAYVVEAKDESALQGLIQAIDTLALGKSRAVLIISAQSFDSINSIEYVENSLGKSTPTSFHDFSQIAAEGVSACIISRPGIFTHPEGNAFPRISSITRLSESLVEEGDGEDLKQVTLAAEFRTADTSALSRSLSKRSPSVSRLAPECHHGYSYANAPMSALKVLIDELSQRDNSDQGIVFGKCTSSYEWVITINAKSTCSENCVAQLPAEVLASSAIFGEANGIEAYWEKLSDERGAIIDIGEHFNAHLFEEKRVGPKDSFYSCTASFNPSRTPDYAEDLRYVAQQTLNDLELHKFIKSDDRILAVTATCLTGFEERLKVFEEFIPRLKILASDILKHAALSEANESLVRSNLDGLISNISYHSITLGSDLSAIVSELTHNKVEAVAVEAACAGSLAALDIALNALQTGRVDCAVVMGIEHPVNVNDMTLCSSQRMLAPEIIATFTELATGFTPGNGAGAIILKRHDNKSPKPQMLIHSVGASTWSKSVIAPNVEGQVNAMRAALSGYEALIPDVTFIETHGTGTAVGDVVEVESINTVYGCEKRESPLYLGALKTRFGHTFAAAGIASVIKTRLIAQHTKIPSNVIRGPKKESLQLAAKHLNVLENEIALNHGESYITAINAFGTGGINYHVLAEITINESVSKVSASVKN